MFLGLSGVLGCSSGPGRGHDFSVGGPAGEHNTFATGEVVWIGTSGFEMTTDGTAELLEIQALGLPATVSTEAFVIPIEAAGGALGAFPEAAVPSEHRRLARPLAHYKVSRSDPAIQAIVRFVMPSSDVTVTGYILTYERSGSEFTTFIPYSDHLCHDTSATCEWIEPHE